MNETGFSCSLSEEDEYEGGEMLLCVVATWERGGKMEAEEGVKGQVSATGFN